MVWLRLVLIACLLLVQIGFTQIRAVDVFQQDTDLRVEFSLPENAVIGSTSERKAAWDALSEEEREELFRLVSPYLVDALEKSKESYEKNGREKNTIEPPSQIGYVDWGGVQRKISTNNSLLREPIQELLENSNWAVDESLDDLSRNTVSTKSIPVGNMPANMPPNFSENLADLFTPYYVVSGGEPNQFATFQNNQVELKVDQLRGQTPQSYYRVHPMGFAMQNGTKHGFFKLDYLTLWNHDSGLAINPYAYVNTWISIFFDYGPAIAFAILNIIDGLDRGHSLDVERSAILVGAPVVANNYNPSPSAYYVYDAFAAAHEGTPTDRSAYASISTPYQGHTILYLALSKHATYFGNPNGLPLTPAWIINDCYFTAQYLFLSNIISFSTYSALMYYFDLTFFEAITERFLWGGYQGLTPQNVPNTVPRRINVGEPVIGQILNNCGFIMTMPSGNKLGVKPKLTSPIWAGFSPY
jgi:hypothetical protein